MFRPIALVFAAVVGLAGCDATKNSPRPLAKTATLDLYVVSASPTPGPTKATDPTTNAQIFLTTPAIISTMDIATAQRSQEAFETPSLTFNLTPTGAKKLAAATAQPAGMQVAFVINETVVSTFKLVTPLSSKGFSVSGGHNTKNRQPLFASLTEE